MKGVAVLDFDVMKDIFFGVVAKQVNFHSDRLHK